MQAWYAVASSADGTRLAAGIYPGGIYTSTNSGGTWTPSGAPGTYWNAVASSDDGTLLAGAIYGGGIYTSIGTASNLLVNTTYHFQLVGLNSTGTTPGADLTFTTLFGAPTVTTLAANNITTNSATLNGTVKTGGLLTTAYFQYGLTTNYDSYSATNSVAATNMTLSVSNVISSLASGTTYHFRLVGINASGTALGADIVFATGPIPPGVTTLPATGVTATSATLNGTVNPNGAATTAYFQYGLTTSYGDIGAFTVLPATNSDLPMPGLVVSSMTGVAGTDWTQASLPLDFWQSIASSADGTRLAAVVYRGGIWTSTNSGLTWTQASEPANYWQSMIASKD